MRVHYNGMSILCPIMRITKIGQYTSFHNTTNQIYLIISRIKSLCFVWETLILTLSPHLSSVELRLFLVMIL